MAGACCPYQTKHNAGGKAQASDFAKGMCGYFGRGQPTSDSSQDKMASAVAGDPVATYRFIIVNNAEREGSIRSGLARCAFTVRLAPVR